MGTTVSTNLALIKPDIDESIKEDLPTFAGWASQNEDNMDVIDALFRNSTSTPSLTWGATTTPPTLGAGGFTEGKLLRLWPRMCFYYFRIFAGGAGFAVGTGTYTLNLPVAMDVAFASFSQGVPIGKMIYQDNSAIATSSIFGLIYNPSTGVVNARPSAGDTWDTTTPVAPAQNDRYSGYMMYPTAAA